MLNLRSHILTKYVQHKTIYEHFGHDVSTYIPWFVRLLFFCIVFLIVYEILFFFVPYMFIRFVFAVMGLLLYGYMMIDFFNTYLDGILIVDDGLVVFRWEGLLEYKTDFFERGSIQMVSHSQKSLWQHLRNSGDITILLQQDVRYDFDHVNRPLRVAQLIQKYKTQHLLKDIERQETEQSLDHEKFNVLVETLGEVIIDYMKQSPQK